MAKQWKPETYTAEEIVNLIRSEKITVPLYQRGQIWDQKKEEALIESIKLGYPFGSILLYKRSEDSNHLIDGLQRCTTLYRYLENPARYFSESLDVDEDVINRIYEMMGTTGDAKATKEKIKNKIFEWVTKNHVSMSDISNIRSNKCVEYLISQFGSINKDEYFEELDDILNDMFKHYKSECDKIRECAVPAIVYTGDESLLPEIFSRINQKGVTLNKYQILAATWTTKSYKITDEKLVDILDYVSKFYSSIKSAGFSLSDYDESTFRSEAIVNLYQLIFGFGKLLTAKYPYLFGSYKSDKNIESCGFNLINACLANRNAKLSDLSEIFDECFENDSQMINNFLVKVLSCVEIVNKIIEPYAQFKLNNREKNANVFHTEMQICSAISNLFISRHMAIQVDDESVIARKIELDRSSSDWDHTLSAFKKNFLKVYIMDLLGDRWAGTGDKTLDSISINKSYYTRDVSIDSFEESLKYWFNTQNESKQEYKKVASVSSVEKLLLCLIYMKKFTAEDQLDRSNYDIEHLCTKRIMERFLDKFNGDEKLPISSFGNICLLPEWDNRKKKDKTLYQDDKYLSTIGDKLSLVEEKYSFTKKEDMEWLNNEYDEFDSLKKDYFEFLNHRFDKQKKEIINQVFK